MSGSSNLNSFRDRGQVAVQLVSCGVLLPGLVQDCTQQAMICTFDSNTNFFDMIAGDFLGDTLASYMFLIYLDNLIRMSIDLIKENGFTPQKKVRNR